VYLTIVSFHKLTLSRRSTLSDIEERRKSRTSSTVSGTLMSSWSRAVEGISMIPIRCIILTLSFRASAFDCIVPESVKRRISNACGIIDCPTCRSECDKRVEIVDKIPVFYVNVADKSYRTSSVFSSRDEKTSIVHAMNGVNSSLQTSRRERTLAYRMADASRSFPGDPSPRFAWARSLATRLCVAVEDSILARSNGARQIKDNHRIRIYVVCHCKFGVDNAARTGSRRYTSLGRKRTVSDLLQRKCTCDFVAADFGVVVDDTKAFLPVNCEARFY